MTVQAQIDSGIQQRKLVIVAGELQRGEEILGGHAESLLVGTLETVETFDNCTGFNRFFEGLLLAGKRTVFSPSSTFPRIL